MRPALRTISSLQVAAVVVVDQRQSVQAAAVVRVGSSRAPRFLSARCLSL
jgi:hypothetical protein